jgi:hypothetical protein
LLSADSAAIGGSALERKYVALDRSNKGQNFKKLQQKKKTPKRYSNFFKNKTKTNDSEIKLHKVNN